MTTAIKCSTKEGKRGRTPKYAPTTRLPGEVCGGGTPLYKRYRYLLTHRFGFLRRFGLKMSIHFANFGLESGMVFEGTTRLHERIYRFNSK